MGKNWAIAVGIDNYYNLKPLKYARSDAEAIATFCSDEVNFHHVDFFAENAPPISTDYGPPLRSEPTFGNLRTYLRKRFEESFLEPGDNLWFFFAGHGKRYRGRDYLMPIDGDPNDVESLGLAIRDIADRLRRSGADNVILMLDACRGEGDRDSGEGLGVERQQGVITLFSCSDNELSYEIDELKQGAFTHSLLQGLRIQGEGNCATVERLYQHLRIQVPELNRRYKKGVQTPYAIVEPATKYHLILLPRQATLQDVLVLKNDALQAEVKQDWELAEQLWMRVLVVSPADREAVAALRRIPPPSAQSSTQPKVASSEAASRSTISEEVPQPPQPAQPHANLEKPTPEPTKPVQPPFETKAATSGATDRYVSEQLPSKEPATQVNRAHSNRKEELPSPPPGTNDTKEGAVSTFSFDVVTITVEQQGGILGIDGKTVVSTKRQRKEARMFSETLENGTALEMVFVPAGSFQMGSPTGQGDNDERPQHSVSVDSFWMGRYTVTQAQYLAVIGENPSRFTGDDHLPVENVSWNDAKAFCDRLSQLTGRIYRLPSEAEWEYACRAGTMTPFHFGETITTEVANYDGNYTYGSGPKGAYRQKTTPVGSFGVANAFGLYDMHGNVWEWCEDVSHDSYAGAPPGGTPWKEGGDCSRRVLRGGSWGNYPRYCRSAYRVGGQPGGRSGVYGFRVACSSA